MLQYVHETKSIFTIALTGGGFQENIMNAQNFYESYKNSAEFRAENKGEFVDGSIQKIGRRTGLSRLYKFVVGGEKLLIRCNFDRTFSQL